MSVSMYIILFLHAVLNHVIPFPPMEFPIFFSIMRIFRLPVIHLSSFFIVRRTTYALLIFCNIRYVDYRLSPINTMSLFNMADLRSRGAVYILIKTTYTHFTFRYEQNVGASICYISGTEIPYSPITLLFTLSTHSCQCPPGLVKHRILCWAHTHL